MLIFVAPIDYKNIFTRKISRFTVSIETATAMHTKGTESKRSIFYCYRISSKNSALLIIRHPLPNIVSNFSAKVVMCICYKGEWNADAEKMLNINL